MEGCDYKIGRFTLQPFRQLLIGRSPVVVGRKPLELLSVLARAEGKLVTKNELMSAIWPNTIVEENALQSHIAGLRKLLGPDAELLSTVHGFGYRLETEPAKTAPTLPDLEGRPIDPPAAATAPARPSWHYMSVAAVTIFLVAGLAWFLRDEHQGSSAPENGRVAVLQFDTHGQQGAARAFGEDVLDEIVSQLSDHQIQAVSRVESQSLRADGSGRALARLGVDLVLDGTVENTGKSLDVHLYLDDAREHISIWSADFHGSTDAAEALKARIATRATDILFWAEEGRSRKYRLDPATLAAFIVARESTVGNRGSFNASPDYRKVIAAAPDFSWGHSGVAATDGFEMLGMPESPRKAQLRKEVHEEAARALKLEPHNGEAYLALELATPRLDWKDREKLLLEGASADPQFEPILMMEGRLLWAVGRNQEALYWFGKAHNVNPLHNGETWSLALSLACQGEQAKSAAVVSQMQKEWPDHPSTRDAVFWTSLVAGSDVKTLRLLEDPSTRPSGFDKNTADIWDASLKARETGDAGTKAEAIKLVKDAVASHSLNAGLGLTALAMLGDIDGAFAEARLYQPTAPYPPPFLFLPMTAAMRSDPRFMPLASKLGLTAYWQSGNWPDFCREPGRKIDCRVEIQNIKPL